MVIPGAHLSTFTMASYYVERKSFKSGPHAFTSEQERLKMRRKTNRKWLTT
jgi:hypothetical protein